jgi:hypothetical protein
MLGHLRRGAVATLSVAAVLAAAACGSGTTSATASSPTTSPSAATTSRPGCPNPEGHACLGGLTAGRYHTSVFVPQITYSVPDRWQNFEDTPGNFLLTPPAFDLEGVDAGTSDFIGVYGSVAAPAGCDPGYAAGVPISVPGMASWLMTNPAFEAPRPRQTTVGGLSGVVVDLRMAADWQTACPYSNGRPVAPMIVGVGRSGLDHNVMGGQATRLYLLDHGGEVLAIEVVDVKDAGHLDAYSHVVDTMEFGS